MMVPGILLALAMQTPQLDILSGVKFLTCADWAKAANVYIEMGQDAAVSSLVQRSENRSKPDRSMLMIRLLFEPKGKVSIYAPPLGSISIPDRNMRPEVWPKLPFTIEQGVIFLLSESHHDSGPRFSVSSYADFCVKWGKFRSTAFKIPAKPEAKAALQELLDSAKWKSLDWRYNGETRIAPDYTVSFLTKQTEINESG